ncbi:MAG: complex I subunit 5 family protein [Muribaculum sp.]|nr:complex I subunit 5 family protein [Muribaculum sp.]
MADWILNHLYCLAYVVVFAPMAAAVLGWLIGKYRERLRDYYVSVVCLAEFALLLFLFVLTLRGIDCGTAHLPDICGMGLSFRMDGFRVLYGTVAAFLWFMTTLFSKEYFAHYQNRNRYYFFLLLTLGGTVGVFLAQDFFSIFVFFELMSLASYAWVAHDERKESLRAADTYLGVSVIGGLVMLMGLFLLYGADGRLLPVAGLCLLFGFGAKAGAFPMHIWLPKAHPVAPAPASALLSGVLTKTGVYGILLLSATLFWRDESWGTLILALGTVTMALGALLALFSVDLKRTLACSSVSQIGFVLVGAGLAGLMGEEDLSAVRGAVLHMVNHSLIKLVLFLAAGVVFMNLHKLDLNDVRGFGRKKPLLHYCFLMGMLGICGIPLWNGYVSKTLLHESIVEVVGMAAEGRIGAYVSAGMLRGVEWIFLISGGLTVAYMTKLYVALFWEMNPDRKVQERFDALGGRYMNRVSGGVLAVGATLLPLLGCLPDVLMGRLADLGQSLFPAADAGRDFAAAGGQPAMAWFGLENLKGAGISLGIGAVVYLFVVRGWMMRREGGSRIYVNRWSAWLDLENLFYRPVLLRALPFVCGVCCRVLDSLVDTAVVCLRRTILRDSALPAELEEGNLLTHAAGCVGNGLQRLGNRFRKKEPGKVDYEHKFALLYQEWSEDSLIIGRSLSFGLLLFCVGLLLTVVYLLWAA